MLKRSNVHAAWSVFHDKPLLPNLLKVLSGY
jgi:hypothetical protein